MNTKNDLSSFDYEEDDSKNNNFENADKISPGRIGDFSFNEYNDINTSTIIQAINPFPHDLNLTSTTFNLDNKLFSSYDNFNFMEMPFDPNNFFDDGKSNNNHQLPYSNTKKASKAEIKKCNRNKEIRQKIIDELCNSIINIQKNRIHASNIIKHLHSAGITLKELQLGAALDVDGNIQEESVNANNAVLTDFIVNQIIKNIKGFNFHIEMDQFGNKYLAYELNNEKKSMIVASLLNTLNKEYPSNVPKNSGENIRNKIIKVTQDPVEETFWVLKYTDKIISESRYIKNKYLKDLIEEIPLNILNQRKKKVWVLKGTTEKVNVEDYKGRKGLLEKISAAEFDNITVKIWVLKDTAIEVHPADFKGKDDFIEQISRKVLLDRKRIIWVKKGTDEEVNPADYLFTQKDAIEGIPIKTLNARRKLINPHKKSSKKVGNTCLKKRFNSTKLKKQKRAIWVLKYTDIKVNPIDYQGKEHCIETIKRPTLRNRKKQVWVLKDTTEKVNPIDYQDKTDLIESITKGVLTARKYVWVLTGTTIIVDPESHHAEEIELIKKTSLENRKKVWVLNGTNNLVNPSDYKDREYLIEEILKNTLYTRNKVLVIKGTCLRVKKGEEIPGQELEEMTYGRWQSLKTRLKKSIAEEEKLFSKSIQEPNDKITLPAVSAKYLGIDLPKNIYLAKDNVDDFDTKVELNLKKLSSLIEIDSEILPIKRNHVDFSANKFCLSFESSKELKNFSNEKYLFIMAGRGKEAYIPVLNNVTTKLRIVLVLSAPQKAALGQLPEYIDILTYNNNQADGELLNSITIRRYITLEFSYQAKLANFFMLDDNIRTLIVSKNYANPNISWDAVYNKFSECALQGKHFMLGMHNYYGIPLEYSSKIWFLNVKDLFNTLDNKRIEVSKLLPPLKYAKLPLEDYYLHFALMFLFKQQNNNYMGYKYVFEKDFCSYIRSQSAANLAAKTTKTANVWLNAAAEDFNVDISNFILKLMKETITVAIDNKNRICASKDFSYNLKLYYKIHENPAELETEITYFKKENITKNLYEHQINALKVLASVKANKRLNTFKLPTGSGKTRIQIVWALESLLKGQQVFIVTPYQALVEQMYKDFKELLPLKQLPVIKVMALKNSLPVSQVLRYFNSKTAAMNKPFIWIFCLDSYMKFSSEVNADTIGKVVKIYDESHLIFNPYTKLNNPQFIAKEFYNTEGQYHIGFSATPYKVCAQVKHNFKFSLYDAIKAKVIPEIKLKAMRPVLSLNQEEQKTRILSQIKNIIKSELGKGIIFYKKNRLKELKIYLEQNRQKNDTREIYIIDSDTDKILETLNKIKKSDNILILTDRILIQGYNDPLLTFAIYAFTINNPNKILQALGRICRLLNEASKTFYYLREANAVKIFKQLRLEYNKIHKKLPNYYDPDYQENNELKQNTVNQKRSRANDYAPHNDIADSEKKLKTELPPKKLISTTNKNGFFSAIEDEQETKTDYRQANERW